MCEWGDTVRLRVPVHPDDSHTGEFRWKDVEVDRCLAPIVQALNDAGIYTRGCCCGHRRPGTVPGISLHDGRELVVQQAPDMELGRPVDDEGKPVDPTP